MEEGNDILCVIVNFMCQLNWTQGPQIKHYFWCICENVSRRLTSELVDSSKIAFANVNWHHPIHWGPKKSKRQIKRGNFLFFLVSLIELGHFISSSLALGLEFMPLATLVLRPLNSDWIRPLVFLGLHSADGR